MSVCNSTQCAAHVIEVFCFRFRTDANEGGVEKLSVTKPNKAWLESTYKELPKLCDGHGLRQK